MSERERTRTRSKIGGATQRFLVPAAGIGALAVALVMVLSPTAGAVVPGTVIAAPYKGTESPYSYDDAQGCTKVSTSKSPNFNDKTGVFTTAGAASAKSCPLAHASAEGSYAYWEDGVTVGIPFKTTSTAHTIAVGATWKGAISEAVSDGLAAGVASSCKAPIYIYDYDYHDYEWGYNATYGSFAGYNYSFSDVSNEYPGYSYAAGSPVPKPFHLNATTYEDSYVYKYKERYCISDSYSEIFGEASLLNEKTLASSEPSGSTVGTYSYGEFDIYGTEVTVLNYTESDCYSSLYWYGPTMTTPSVTNYTCSYYNQTSESIQSVYYPSSTSTLGSNNSLSTSASVSGSGTIWFNGTFAAHSSLELFLEIYMYGDVDQTWSSGSATASLNFGTGGNGFDLKSISIT